MDMYDTDTYDPTYETSFNNNYGTAADLDASGDFDLENNRPIIGN